MLGSTHEASRSNPPNHSHQGSHYEATNRNTHQPVQRLASHFPPPPIFLLVLLFFLSHAMVSWKHDTHYPLQITLHLNIYLSYSGVLTILVLWHENGQILGSWH